MSCTREQILAKAKSLVGKNEADGSHEEIIDIYNGHKPLPRGYAVKYTDPWCATTTSALAIECDATDIIPIECSCNKQIEQATAMGIWVEDDSYVPQPADILMYDWDDSGKGDSKGDAEHTGIVEKVVDGKMTVIEGNYDNAVKRRTLSVNGRYIRGYIVPKYTAETVVKPSTPTKSIDELAREVIDGKWGNGSERKARLTAAGHDASAVQNRVNELLKKPTAQTPTKIVHTVVRGDTLWGIAKKYLGNGSRYPEIMKANGLTSTVIYRNQKLTIPNK